MSCHGAGGIFRTGALGLIRVSLPRLTDLMRPTHIRQRLTRLGATIRQEGWRVAGLKTWQFFARRLGRTTQPPPEQYLQPIWQQLAQLQGFHTQPAPAYLHSRPRIAMIADMGLAQCRKYRVIQPAEIWAGLDVDYGFADYRDPGAATGLLQEATHLMVYRLRSDPLFAMYLYEARRLQLPVLYDIDDPLFSIPAYQRYGNMDMLPAALKSHFLEQAPLYRAAMDQADIVSVSTPGLAIEARAHTPRPVTLRRNFADQETLLAAEAARARPARNDGLFRVGFASGSMGHEADFACIRDDICRFLAAAPDRQLVILGHFNLEHLPKTARDRVQTYPFADYADYLARLATLDCALMPLGADPFNACKSAVRVIDAAAVGIPSIIGPVGDLGMLVQDGVTGRVLPKDADWAETLESLARDPAGTQAMGQNARAHLLENWQARAAPPHIIAPELVDWVKG